MYLRDFNNKSLSILMLEIFPLNVVTLLLFQHILQNDKTWDLPVQFSGQELTTGSIIILDLFLGNALYSICML